VIKLIRVPVLLVLLLAGGLLLPRYTREVMLFDVVAAIGPWLLLVAIAVIFVVIATTGRDHHHPGPLLTVEIVISGVLVLAPQIVWAQLLGANLVTDALGGRSGNVFAQILAVVWLVAAVRTLTGQRRSARRAVKQAARD